MSRLISTEEYTSLLNITQAVEPDEVNNLEIAPDEYIQVLNNYGERPEDLYVVNDDLSLTQLIPSNLVDDGIVESEF